MTREELEQIFEETDSKWDGDNALQGLIILAKYKPDNVVQGADHDIIYSLNIYQALEAGLTKEDAVQLALLNWSLDHESDSFACFV